MFCRIPCAISALEHSCASTRRGPGCGPFDEPSLIIDGGSVLRLRQCDDACPKTGQARRAGGTGQRLFSATDALPAIDQSRTEPSAMPIATRPSSRVCIALASPAKGQEAHAGVGILLHQADKTAHPGGRFDEGKLS